MRHANMPGRASAGPHGSSVYPSLDLLRELDELRRRNAELEMGMALARGRAAGLPETVEDMPDLTRRVLEHLPQLTAYVDRGMRFRYVSCRCREIYGLEEHEIVGRQLRDVVGESAFAEILPHVSAVLLGATQVYEKWLTYPDGRRLRVRGSLIPDVDRRGAVRGYVALLTDETGPEASRRGLDEALREREESAALLSTILDTIPDPVCVISPDHRIVRLNRAAQEFFQCPGKGVNEVLGRACHEMLFLGRCCESCPTGEALRTGASVSREYYDARRGRHLACHSAPVLDQDGAPRLVVEILRDVTEARTANRALRASEERYALAVNGAGDGIWDWDLDSDKVYFSPRYKEILGHADHELPSDLYAWTSRLHHEDAPGVLESLRDLVDGRLERFEQEYRLRHKDGGYRWVLGRSICTRDPQGGPRRVAGSLTDVSQRREAQESLRRSLREKETLLREVHHRVKNNLQVVVSLLSLQRSQVGDEQALVALRETESRVRALALVHERLYRSEDLTYIELSGYLRALATHLTTGTGVSTEIDIPDAPVHLSLDQAIPCGLAVNELMSNALKHAFPDGRAGRTRMRVAADAARPNWIEITVADDGVGLPADISPDLTPSLGLSIVRSLIDQLHGEIRFTDASPGTEVVMAFPMTPDNEPR